MNDDRFSNDRFFTAEFDLSLPIQMRFARCVGGDIAEITSMMFGRVRPAVMLVGWIEMSAR